MIFKIRNRETDEILEKCKNSEKIRIINKNREMQEKSRKFDKIREKPSIDDFRVK